jgi:hypothetical protein
MRKKPRKKNEMQIMIPIINVLLLLIIASTIAIN